MLAAFFGCGKNPAQPSASMVVGQTVSPPNGSTVAFASQPITLTVANGVSTGSSSPTYSFEVATDSGFANKVFTKDGVAQGSGSTSTAAGTLSASTTYYWRARLVTDGQGGPYTTVQTFAVGPPITIQVPGVISPAGGSSSGALTVSNSSTAGPAGPLTYRFDVSATSNFASLVFTTVVAEGGNGQTSVSVPSTALVNQATYYWRAEAMDQANGVTSSFTGAQSFQFIGFDMRQAHIFDAPSDLGSWPQTANITSISTSGPFVDVDFDKRDSSDRWPDEPFGDGSIEYTLGMCLNINGQWDCSAVVQFWYGRELDAGGNVNEIGLNWFYDQRWGPMIGHQPSPGETVGIFVGAGNLRDRTAPSFADCPRICERSDVVLLPWGTNYNK
jgi:hypothetical protein